MFTPYQVRLPYVHPLPGEPALQPLTGESTLPTPRQMSLPYGHPLQVSLPYVYPLPVSQPYVRPLPGESTLLSLCTR